MRILILTVDFPPVIGGLSTYSYGVAKELSRLGMDVMVLAQHARGDSDFDRKQKIKIIRVPNLMLLREICYFSWLIYLLKVYKIDRVFNMVWLPCGAISFLASKILNFSFYAFAAGSELFDANNLIKSIIKRKLKWLMILTFKNSTKCFPVSRFTKKILQDNGIKTENLFIIPGGVDSDIFDHNIDFHDLKIKYNLANKKVILTVARLDEHKGVDLVIKSMPGVLKKNFDLVYIIVGEGQEKKKLKELAMNLGLADRAIFVGAAREEDLPKFYSLCDIFVMPSREIRGRHNWFEGFGIVYLEANAYAKPVIGGDSGGVSDAIIHGQTGLLVNPYDVKQLTDAIELLLSDKEYANLLGRQGKERAKKYFSWEAIAQKIENIIE